jgi:hypothetical protein
MAPLYALVDVEGGIERLGVISMRYSQRAGPDFVGDKLFLAYSRLKAIRRGVSLMIQRQKFSKTPLTYSLMSVSRPIGIANPGMMTGRAAIPETGHVVVPGHVV